MTNGGPFGALSKPVRSTRTGHYWTINVPTMPASLCPGCEQ